MVSFGRLKKRADFLRIAAAHKKWVAPGLIIQIDQNREASPRIGFTASKKVGNAVARNRAKRRLREALRMAAAKEPPKGDIVLIARPSTLDRPWLNLVKDIETGLQRLNQRIAEK